MHWVIWQMLADGYWVPVWSRVGRCSMALVFIEGLVSNSSRRPMRKSYITVEKQKAKTNDFHLMRKENKSITDKSKQKTLKTQNDQGWTWRTKCLSAIIYRNTKPPRLLCSARLHHFLKYEIRRQVCLASQQQQQEKCSFSRPLFTELFHFKRQGIWKRESAWWTHSFPGLLHYGPGAKFANKVLLEQWFAQPVYLDIVYSCCGAVIIETEIHKV